MNLFQQTGKHEYDLILNADVNSPGRQQWFYFRVSNITSGIAHTFNVINLEKTKSLFNRGDFIFNVSVFLPVATESTGSARNRLDFVKLIVGTNNQKGQSSL